MKYLIGCLCLMCSFAVFSEFLHPMDYQGTVSEDRRLEAYIIEQVNKEKCTQSKTLCDQRMSATKALEVEAFHQLTKATDRSKLDNLIKMWCTPTEEPCYYGVISMMYNQ